MPPLDLHTIISNYSDQYGRWTIETIDEKTWIMCARTSYGVYQPFLRFCWGEETLPGYRDLFFDAIIGEQCAPQELKARLAALNPEQTRFAVVQHGTVAWLSVRQVTVRIANVAIEGAEANVPAYARAVCDDFNLGVKAVARFQLELVRSMESGSAGSLH